jgi:uncharacterized protein
MPSICSAGSNIKEKGTILTTIEQLLGLQEQDIRINEIRKVLTDIPERKKLEEARLDDQKSAVAEADEAHKQKQSESKQNELGIQAHKERMAKLRTQQMSLKTNQEFKAMDNEIKSIETEISGVEDREIVLMSELDATGSVLEEKNAVLQNDATRVNADLGEWDSRAAEMEAELKTLQDARDADAALIEEKLFLARYETIIVRKQPAIAPLENGICGGCFMQLPPYVGHDIRKAQAPVSCNFCARLLYIA